MVLELFLNFLKKITHIQRVKKIVVEKVTSGWRIFTNFHMLDDKLKLMDMKFQLNKLKSFEKKNIKYLKILN